MSPDISRRSFCKWSSSLVLGGVFAGLKNRLLFGSEPSLEDVRQTEVHTPKLILPATTRNGAHVPVAVKMIHPMQQNHYIQNIQFLNETDPVPSKGIFYPTPANGELYFAFQARMHSGTSTVLAIAECNLHGRWTAKQRITIPAGQGGCATAAPQGKAFQKEAIPPPMIRIPELVRKGRLLKGATTDVQVKFKHPSKTGLAYVNDAFIPVEDPLYVASMQLFYGDRLISRYEMTPGLSDNPFLTFKVKFTEEKPLYVLFTNSSGQQFKAVQPVTFS